MVAVLVAVAFRLAQDTDKTMALLLSAGGYVNSVSCARADSCVACGIYVVRHPLGHSLAVMGIWHPRISWLASLASLAAVP